MQDGQSGSIDGINISTLMRLNELEFSGLVRSNFRSFYASCPLQTRFMKTLSVNFVRTLNNINPTVASWNALHSKLKQNFIFSEAQTIHKLIHQALSTLPTIATVCNQQHTAERTTNTTAVLNLFFWDDDGKEKSWNTRGVQVKHIDSLFLFTTDPSLYELILFFFIVAFPFKFLFFFV